MAPRYGRAKGSERAISQVPYRRGYNITMIGAISIHEVEAAMYGTWSANGDIFQHFLTHHLLPKLQAHHVVVMDNIRFHKMKAVTALIESTGARVIFLPPYSPELNPIEEMWSKIKSILRKHRPRELTTFKKAIQDAFQAIIPQNLQGYFRHAGYVDQ